MKIIQHPVRYLINVSHPEMEALQEIVERGLIDISGDPEPPLSTAARKSLAYWLPKPDAKHKRVKNPLRPKEPHRRPRTGDEPSGVLDTDPS